MSGAKADTGGQAELAAVRAEIDRIDRELVEILAERTRMVDRVVEIKHRHGLPARIEERVVEVLETVQAEAQARGVDPELATELWRVMIEHFIAHEQKRLGE